MNRGDLINGAFEFAGGLAGFYNIYTLLRDKEVKGFAPLAYIYFTAWGAWNLWYYPSLNQPISFWGSVFITFSNGLYTVLAIHFMRRMKRNVHI